MERLTDLKHGAMSRAAWDFMTWYLIKPKDNFGSLKVLFVTEGLNFWVIAQCRR